VETEIHLLLKMREEIERHPTECPRRPKAILLNPANYELLGWDEVVGLPLLPDDRVEPGQARLLCGDAGWGGVFDGKRVWWTEDGSAHHLVDVQEAA
jgi:hypothetical protein